VDGRLEQHIEAKFGHSGRRSQVPDRLVQAIRHAVLGGGKRFRPFLVIESASMFGLTPEAALDVAAAVECVHCYSLAHDDLPAMDNDELRRGRPTVWKAFDQWTAILAGDALQTLAFEILSTPGPDSDPASRLELIAGLAHASGAAGMVGGQALDLEGERYAGLPPSLAHVERLQAMKTGALIAFACEAGAILGRAIPERRAALRNYGEALGLAFQISDDLLDLEGDAATVGKRVAKDAGLGKATFASLLGADGARRELAAAKARALDALSIFDARADTLREATSFVVGRRA
jgi:farnesyl diphosphate synthase